MNRDWRLDFGFRALGRLPMGLPWRLAPVLGHEPRPARRRTEAFLTQRFSQVFPKAASQDHRLWAHKHLAMLAQEAVDASVLHRMGQPGGVRIDLIGWEHVQALLNRGQGFILVLNHFDRLLAAPIALARRGMTLNTMTMPIVDNPELGAAQRAFLIQKVRSFKEITQGQWLTSDEGLRPLHEGLRAGQAWIILADVWGQDFGRLRSHPFLGGALRLPTGIERLARSTGAHILHAVTQTLHPDHLLVAVETLPDNPTEAVNSVVQRLHQDVQKRPWAWWHWGLWEQMWRTSSPGENFDQH